MKPLVVHHTDTLEAHPDIHLPDTHQDTFSKAVLGFWFYLLTDCLLFATLFVTFVVLHSSTFGGPSAQELFTLPLPFAETMFLLFSTVTCGFALLEAVKGRKNSAVAWLAVTFLLGIGFIILEINEFNEFIQEGNSWKRSAFLSSFFALVGTHGAHVSAGLIWMAVMAAQVYHFGITVDTFRRLVIFSLFWHFLDLVWIFIFTFVYLIGVLS